MNIPSFENGLIEEPLSIKRDIQIERIIIDDDDAASAFGGRN